MRIETTDDTDLLDATRKWLGEYNEQFVSWDAAPVHLAAFDDEGDVAAVLVGRTYWGKLRVDRLVVRADRRGQGLGTALMERAERAVRIERPSRKP